MFASFVARQLSHPSGFVGAHVLPRVWNRRNAALNDAAFQALRLQPDDRVLEVGFGGGYLLRKMARVVTHGLVWGVDASPAVTGYAAARARSSPAPGRMALCCGSAEALPYAAMCFTMVCSVNSLFYWPDVRRVFAEMERVLAPRGQVVLCFTCAAFLEGRSFIRHGVIPYAEEDVEQFLEEVGLFVIERTHGFDRHRKFLCLTAARR